MNQLPMSSYLVAKNATEKEGRLAFSSTDHLRLFLGFADSFHCLSVATTTEDERCSNKLSKPTCKLLQERFEDFQNAGFPSEAAEASLLRIALQAICESGVNQHAAVVVTDGRREPQHMRLYNMWHANLWAGYLQINGLVDFPMESGPPLLHDLDGWKQICRDARQTSSQSGSGGEQPNEGDIFRDRPRRAETAHSAFEARLRTEVRPVPVRRDRAKRLPTVATAISSLDHLADQTAPIVSTATHASFQVVIETAREVFEENSAINTQRQTEGKATAELGLATEGSVDEKAKNEKQKGNETTIPATQEYVTPSKTRTEGRDELREDEMGITDVTPMSVASSIATPMYTPLHVGAVETPPTELDESGDNKRLDDLDMQSKGSPKSRKQPDDSAELPLNHEATVRDVATQVVLNTEADIPESTPADQVADYCDPTADEAGERKNDDLAKFSIILYYYSKEKDDDKNFPFLEGLRSQYRGVINFKTEPRIAPVISHRTTCEFESMDLNNEPRRQLTALLAKLDQPIRHLKRQEPGCVYGFTRTGSEKYIKIGWAKSMRDRLRDFERVCEYEPVPLFNAQMPCAAGIMEYLVHRHLHEIRRRDNFCSVKETEHARQHKEWFDIDLKTAVETVAQWHVFSWCIPFQGLRLTAFWRDEVDATHREAVRSADPSPDLWVKRMATAVKVARNADANVPIGEANLALRVRAGGRATDV
jgi:hypothetical protein